MTRLYPPAAAFAVLLATASLWLPATPVESVPSSSVAGPVVATYGLPLVA